MFHGTASERLFARVAADSALLGFLSLRFVGAPGLVGALGLVLGILTSSDANATQTAADPNGAAFAVATVELRATSVAPMGELDGTLQAVRQSSVSAQVGGNVVQRLVKAGDEVRAGQPLVHIDERQTQAGVASSQAAVARAQAELAEAQAAYERNSRLVSRGFVSQAALDTAQARLRIAQAAERESIAERSKAALARNFATVVAPYDGLVLATHVETGDFVAPGRPIALVYAPQPIRAVVHVPASQQAALREAWPVEVRLPSGERAAAVSREAIPGVDPVTQTFEFRFDLPPDATHGWVPGRSVRVRFPQGAAERIIVPSTAILRRGELTAVYVARGERFILRAVRLGAAHAGAGMAGADITAAGIAEAGIEVLAGVAEGERIAVDAVRAGLYGAVPVPAPH